MVWPRADNVCEEASHGLVFLQPIDELPVGAEHGVTQGLVRTLGDGTDFGDILLPVGGREPINGEANKKSTSTGSADASAHC